ncbi:MAG TPA: NUDIX hydrolase [Cyclobacteriaceae bacterium]|nr:NUDIX hydrolase [Cyclobacteriaceae bacterium]
MSVHRRQLNANLRAYSTPFVEEEKFVQRFLELLNQERAFYRDHLPGHITASAWIVDEEKSHALLVHHAKLDRWLQPGGHADGDENILNVATREVEEETGLTNLSLLVPGIFDLDIHPIPARKDFPEHLHYDVRFAFVASLREELKISNESHDLKWVTLKEVPDITNQNSSILRMVRKTLGADQQ